MSDGAHDEGTLLTNDVRELLRIVGQSDIVELLIERGPVRLHLKRAVGAPVAALPAAAPAAPHASSAPPAAQQQAEPGLLALPAGHTITAPMVGTYYSAPSPKDAPFVHEGDEVHAGDAVGIIEAMKMMNEIESDVGGRVARILVKNGQPVEYGQALMVIQPL
jgi:acetyl-CoA carboxylase biotin carboxyl carrier protein